MEIVFILLAFIALLLIVIWRPLFKQEKNQQNAELVASTQKGVREQTNIDLYHEHKSEIERDFNEGAIDEENYQYLLAELDKSLLQDVSATESDNNSATSTKPFSVLWPISLSIFVLVFSVALYVKQGTLATLMSSPTPAQANQQSAMSAEQQEQNRQEQMLAYIDKMQQHLDANPEDSEAWYNLGQTFVGAGEFDFAIKAFEQVIRIEGEHADLLGAIAQASYYKNNQQIDEHVQTLIDRALALDINDPSTNILLGMHHFMGQKYQPAIEYWQRVIDANKPGVNIAALQEAVNEAKKRINMPASSSALESSASQVVDGPQLKVRVSLSEEILSQLSQDEDKVVFVYATPTSGKRVPLAALKLMASDLPKVITLDNSNAMSAQSNLSSVTNVHLYAVVSKQGAAGIKPGDYKAELHNVAVNDNADTINLVINSLVE
ncbi:hypothetical protein NBRC116592_04530 [Colwellia sp. KU-HH00111]|uniref:c-type cytochrome biogenesis protein CcmI n=1 Tax=Colwellia sp. KU-HH00111 TaxID=3127652 RepID=UPI00310A581A